MAFKSPLEQSNDLLREARRNTLNKRINRKGNYELAITGGSHALDNQAFKDSNEYALAINDPNSGWPGNPDLEGLNNRYENKEGQNIDLSPKTRRGRRLADLYFNRGYGRLAKNPNEAAEALLPYDNDVAIAKISKYERGK